ncbi:MAG: MOSC domain-containing protein [Pseudomonadota bacterium]
METLATLTARHAQAGRVTWLGVRPERHAPLLPLERAEIDACGLRGDHRSRPGKRAVSLIQAEHLPVIAALLGIDAVPPETLRRNIVVAGINLLGLRNRRFRIGTAVFEGTGLCAPCSRMEATLGEGGYSAVRGHGGITAAVLEGGTVSLGDNVTPVIETAENHSQR